MMANEPATEVTSPNTEVTSLKVPLEEWAEERAVFCAGMRELFGFKMLPLVGKRPPAGYPWREADEDFLVEPWFWEQYPNANLGVQTCDRVEGVAPFFVVDIDGDEGERSWTQIRRACRQGEGASLEVLTGRGRHLYFEGDGGRTGRIADGLDIKSRGGYVVAPPSIHPERNTRYTWRDMRAPGNQGGIDVHIEPTPQSADLVPLISSMPRAGGGGHFGTSDRRYGPTCDRGAFRRACLLQAGLPEGHREHDFYWAVATWLDAGVSAEDIWQRARRLWSLSNAGGHAFPWDDARKRTQQCLDRNLQARDERVALTEWAKGGAR